MMRSHVERLQGLTLIGRLRKVNDKGRITQDNKLEASIKKPDSTLKPKILLL